VAASTPKTAWGLSAASQDTAKQLAVVELSLDFVCLHFNYDMTKACPP